MNKKRMKRAVVVCVCVLAVITALGAAFVGYGRRKDPANLALQRGVTATSDSAENDGLSADKAIDGDDSTLSSRWSSENNWEDASHYIQLEFPTEISVSFVVLKWERRNATSYALESSMDGETWETLQKFDTAPETKRQEIALPSPVTVRFLRLSTYEVSRREEDYSNLYQNISLYEFEVYADKPAAYRLGQAEIGAGEDGGRVLVMPAAPEGYEVVYLGADYEQIIDGDGVVHDTLQEKEVTVGFLVRSKRDGTDAREISQTLSVPAAASSGTGTGMEAAAEIEFTEEQELPVNGCPEVVPALAEWQGGRGGFTFSEKPRIIVEEGSTLQDEAELFAKRYTAMTQCEPEVISGRLADAGAGDLYLGYVEDPCGLGKEGYLCDIDDKCVILAESDTGVRWGTVTLLQMAAQADNLPRGRIRDYPRYEVRGFGIDVARKAVSMDTLYAIMETMSYYKMNDLTIHLNDNVILSTSGLADSVEHALTADSAFRLESDVANANGEKLTSSEYSYSKEAFAQLIADAKSYGVTVVPEIDTPAHSLSVTKLFPEYALTARAESVDQIDLGNADAVALVKQIWQEALTGEQAAFRKAKIVNIGMDEYYGDGEQYRNYLNEIADLVSAEGKTVRLWGSLSNIAGTTMPDPDGLQMNLWSTVWADPREMYEAGYCLINMQNNHLYVIPGGGYDYLDAAELYENWEPNKFYDYNLLELLPAYSPQMLGAVYMMWNDMSGSLDVGICEYDLYDRFEQPLPMLAAKLWGQREELTYGEFRERADRIGRDARGLSGKKNRLYDEAAGLEPDYEVTIRVKPAGDATGAQIISESDSAYGVWAFYAAEPVTGKVGFAREGRTYTWNYKLPRDVWTELKVVGEPGRTTLYADGELVGALGNENAFEEYATFVFPLERIGGATGAFDGEVTVNGEASGSADGTGTEG